MCDAPGCLDLPGVQGIQCATSEFPSVVENVPSGQGVGVSDCNSQ